jgi:RimJ/RimL family protein N-acetyltransferase
MPDKNTYLFTSERLGFRNWRDEDIALMCAINADPDVMEFFPSTQDEAMTRNLIGRMQQQFADKGYCYFAVDKLEDNQLIGFIGLSWQTYEAYFTPCVDIGWRLDKKAWNKGFATEGAKRCLSYAFDTLGLDKIYSVASAVNHKSIAVMKKIGMRKANNFVHPKLAGDERLRECAVYEIRRDA